MSKGLHLHSVSAWALQLFYGVCIGLADLVPGISGGTMALVLGIYEEFIFSIQSFGSTHFLSLFTGQWKRFSRFVLWDYLLGIVAGIILAFALFSQVIQMALANPVSRKYLYALFVGMIIASFKVCYKKLKTKSFSYLGVFLLSAFVTYLLTNYQRGVNAYVGEAATSWIDWWLIFCGAIAITATLLPGLSGSYVLNIFGVYAPAISSLADFFREGTLNSIIFLGNLGVGILIGAVSFSKIITYLLKHFHDVTLVVLLGFMVGGLHTVWPFFTHEYVLKPLRQLRVVGTRMPSFYQSELYLCIGVAVLGFVLVFFLEKAAKTSKQ